MGLRILVRFLATGFVSPYIPSAILSTLLSLLGFQLIMLGMIADMLGGMRVLQERTLYLLKEDRLGAGRRGRDAE